MVNFKCCVGIRYKTKCVCVGGAVSFSASNKATHKRVRTSGGIRLCASCVSQIERSELRLCQKKNGMQRLPLDRAMVTALFERPLNPRDANMAESRICRRAASPRPQKEEHNGGKGGRAAAAWLRSQPQSPPSPQSPPPEQNKLTEPKSGSPRPWRWCGVCSHGPAVCAPRARSLFFGGGVGGGVLKYAPARARAQPASPLAGAQCVLHLDVTAHPALIS
jgi:hypothetical protein